MLTLFALLQPDQWDLYHVRASPSSSKGTNKVSLLTMSGGKEVIVKLPNSNVGHAGFITASEVATMGFVHTHSLYFLRSNVADHYPR